jgi:hypothetical protein
MDPTWLGYQNILDRIRRYLEKHWRLGKFEEKLHLNKGKV